MRLLRMLASVAVLAASLAANAPLSAEPGSSVPVTESVVLDTARAMVAAGDSAGAIGYLLPYVKGHPADAAAGRLLGDLYFRIPDYRKAEAVWRGVLAGYPADRDAHNRLGALYAAEDRTDEAIAEFQKSLPSRDGYAGLVTAHKKAGDLPAFLARLNAHVQTEPMDARGWSTLGSVQRFMKQYDTALFSFGRAASLQPRSCEARVDLAIALLDVARVDPAMAELRACLAMDANNYPAVVNLGEAYLEKNDDVTARPYFDRALALRPSGYEALVDLGYVLDTHGDWKNAVTYYNRALVSDPLRTEAYINLGYDYNEHRLYPLAEAAFLKGLSVASDDGRLHYMLAVTYNLQGKIGLARQQYHDAIASDEPVVVRAAKTEMALLPER